MTPTDGPSEPEPAETPARGIYTLRGTLPERVHGWTQCPFPQVLAQVRADALEAGPRLARLRGETEDRLARLEAEDREVVTRRNSQAMDIVLVILILSTCGAALMLALPIWLGRHLSHSRQDRERSRACADLRQRLEYESRRVHAMRSDPEREARERVRGADLELSRIDGILSSSNAKGAVGELDVIRHLESLDDSYRVLNDLELIANGFMRYDGEPVQTAQIDHLVIGPTGIFVIETKAWSSKFAASGNGFDPFKQVARAGLLCHVILKEAHLPADVRKLIARNGHLPSSPHMKYVEALRPSQLASSIRRRQGQLAPAQVNQIADYLWRRYGPSTRN